MARASKAKRKQLPKAKSYRHTESESAARPDVGTQAQFKKKKPPKTYRYDFSLAPEMNWDGQNPARELGEWLLAKIEEAARCPDHRFAKPEIFKNGHSGVMATVQTIQDAIDQLKRLGKPFLNWTGKIERLSFDVPTLPLFIHERLSTKAIIETLKTHRKDKGVEQIDLLFDLFGDPQRPITDQVLKAYEYQDKWINRMILGDSLVVMNSLLQYENLGGQVQMIYMDPPYGVKFGSNFQPFVRKRDVKHNEDDDFTREPEMVQAYRDTWELGLHSYFNFLRDRLRLCRDLLDPSGSLFIQISDENVHHLRELLDEVFGAENFVSQISFAKTTGFSGRLLSTVADYLLWYAKDINRVKYRHVYRKKEAGDEGAVAYKPIRELPVPHDWPWDKDRLATSADLTSQGETKSAEQTFTFMGRQFAPPNGLHWKTTIEGLKRVEKANRIFLVGNTLRYLRLLEDFPVFPISNTWTDTGIAGYSADKIYAVQTLPKVIERCILMTTDPGDLVLDPTCGSGTSSYVSEKWGRRWITIDVSRVPLALARQRLLTATFPYYQLKDEIIGPSSGFVYQRRQNKRGEEVGGIVPHVTLESIANNETPKEEVLVDKPEEVNKIVRITGPFCVEATIPTPMDWAAQEEAGDIGLTSDETISFEDRMIEVLRKAPVLHLGGGKTVTLKNVRRPAKTLSLSAEAAVEATSPGQKSNLTEAIDEADDKYKGKLPLTIKLVSIVFGPENGAVSEKLVYEAAKEASAKRYTHLYIIGFAIQPNARRLIEDSDKMFDMPATYIQATPDLMMGDLLKSMRSSQIFSVCGLPDVELKLIRGKKESPDKYQAELKGLDVFDPTTMETIHMKGDDVPAWFLDTDYNGLCFHVCQAFFPRTSAWDSLKRALKGLYSDTVWDHLRGAKSVPFEAGEHGQIAVKVIDDRGNELLVIKSFSEAGS